MSSNNGDRERVGTLQREYRRAWKTLIAEAEVLQRAIAASACSDDISAARMRAETAATNYRAARNGLAQALLADTRKHRVETEPEPELLAACCAGN